MIANLRSRSAGFAQWPLLVVLAFLGLAVALYAVVGTPELAADAVANHSAQPGRIKVPLKSSQDGDSKAGSVESLLEGLEQRLHDNPNDAKSWLLLAKSYNHLDKRDAAREAYAKATALGFTDPKLEKALTADGSVASGSSQTISGVVTLGDEVAELVEPTDTVFIIARATDGSPMPLAVQRRSAAELPLEFTLDDSNAMLAGRGLAAGELVVVSAKVSKTGDALVTSSQLEASSGPLDPGAGESIELMLARPGAASQTVAGSNQ